MANLPNTLGTSGLEKMIAPKHKALAEFIHHGSDDPVTRTVAVTTLGLSLWQHSVRDTDTALPSLLLVNAGGSPTDPIHDVIESLLGAGPYDMGKKPREGQGRCDGRSSTKAPGTMHYAYSERKKRRGKTDIISSPQKPILEKLYRDACATCYGKGRISNYSKVWHPELGLITDSYNSILLRLNDDEDLAAFRQEA